MVLTESEYILRVGEKAPSFALREPLTGKTVSYEDVRGAKGTVVMFICNHCPFVIHLKASIAVVAKEYLAKGVGFVAISSNSTVTHPQDGPDEMARDATAAGYPFPYLFDETQAVAKDYKAACTPEFYVFDTSDKLVYHGRWDASRPGKYAGPNPVPITASDIRAALDALVEGRDVPQAPGSIGCNIKWAPGSEPHYFKPGGMAK